MPLLDLQTNLKSLKYGNDRPGGGNSGQPYYQANINSIDKNLNKLTNFDGGLVRGGAFGAANASNIDTFRISKFLIDFPRGPLFITKQVGLQLSNPQTEHKTNFPTNQPTKGQGLIKNIGNFISNTANKIQNNLGPTRIYNLGINTLAQVQVNAFGDHIVRHGFNIERDDSNLYFKVAQYNNNEGNNRLVQLTSILGTTNDINEYNGGPNSFYGIGTTLIRRRGDFIDVNRDTTATSWAVSGSVASGNDKRAISVADASRRIFYFLGVSNKFGSIFAPDYNINNGEAILYEKENQPSTLDDQNITTYTLTSKVTNVDANARAGKFSRLSTKVSSSFASFRFDKDGDTNLKDNPIGLNEIAKSQSYTGSATWTPGSGDPSRPIDKKADLGLSTKISSSFAPYRFDKDGDTNIKDSPTGLNEVAKFQSYTGSTTWTPGSGNPSRPVNKKADLGLSKIANDIPTGSIDINQNVISYSPSANTNARKYNELRSKITKDSQIKQQYFKTIPVNVSRNDPNFKYVKAELANKFNRTNDRVIEDDSLALQFIPLDPFTGIPLNILKFLGYITDFSETYDSTWADVNYAGRAESFYIFNKFKRTASVGFNITCYNAVELEERHCALSELASVLSGKYQDNLLMGGIITRLKLGRYIDNQPGIITNLSFNPIQDSSWDLDRQLAFYLKVSFGFTLIHDFLPQYHKCGFIDRTPEVPNPPPTPTPVPVPTPPPPLPPSPNPIPGFTPGPSPEIRRDEAIYGEQYRIKQYNSDLDKRFRNYYFGKRTEPYKYGGGSSGGAGASGTVD